METASLTAPYSGNVLDLNAYRQQRQEALALRKAREEEAWVAFCEEAYPEVYAAPAPRARRRRSRNRLGEVMDVAASVAMVLSALVLTAVVLL